MSVFLYTIATHIRVNYAIWYCGGSGCIEHHERWSRFVNNVTM